MGRPSTYSQDVAAEICGRLAGGEALSKICAEEGLPALRTVYVWLQQDAEFAQLYARAREEQADTLADQILEIADEPPPVSMTGEDGSSFVIDGAAVQLQRLRIDARKWVASKLKPKKYGDKVAQEISGPDGGAIPMRTIVNFVTPGAS